MDNWIIITIYYLGQLVDGYQYGCYYYGMPCNICLILCSTVTFNMFHT